MFFSSWNLLTIFVGRGNPSVRPMLTRIYGMLGCLAVTLFFIGLMVFLEKTLPDGSKSEFHPTWRRDNSIAPRMKAEVGERGLVFRACLPSFDIIEANCMLSACHSGFSSTTFHGRPSKGRIHACSGIQSFSDRRPSLRYYPNRLLYCQRSREVARKIQ